MEEKKLKLTLDFTLHSGWGFQSLESYLGGMDGDEMEELEKREEEDGFDLEQYYVCEVLDPECPEVYRYQEKKNVERLVERIRADLQPSIDAILGKNK